MAGRQTADIVFCMDASGSMSNAIDKVRKNIIKLVESLQKGLQVQWDVRYDFLAYSATNGRIELTTVNYDNTSSVLEAIYKNSFQNKLFTSDLKEFKKQLGRVSVDGDEATIPALDTAADFPWRDAADCHRVIVLLTDETVDTGVMRRTSKERLMDLANKLQEKKIMLFMTTPDCAEYDTLSQIDKCEWNIDTSEGLDNVNFTKLMESIGKSVSMSQTNGQSCKDRLQPLFGQDKKISSGWTI